jgi:serine/arginine repetitive matrix protein 2
MDSAMSDFSALHLGRPGIGDKMFDRAVDLGPLTSISASPPTGFEVSDSGYNHTSYDSVMDDEQRSSMEDSLFEKTGQRSSVSSDSVFGDDMSHPYARGLLPPNQFRPLSVLSLNSSHGPVHEDDTMISVGIDHILSRVALMNKS